MSIRHQTLLEGQGEVCKKHHPQPFDSKQELPAEICKGAHQPT
jgi:hypothetical protein